MKRILMLVLAVALTVSGSACQDTTSPGAVLAGTYTLRTIEGQPLPVAVGADPINGTKTVVAGQITMDRDGHFTDVLRYRYDSGQEYDDEIDGTWTLSGNTLQFYDVLDPNNTYYGSVSGNQLAVQGYVTYTLVYSK